MLGWLKMRTCDPRGFVVQEMMQGLDCLQVAGRHISGNTCVEGHRENQRANLFVQRVV